MTTATTSPLGPVKRFFFTPTDPTTLGFMRILTGLLMLYTHAVYCVELEGLLGPNAWYGQDLVNRQRRDQPTINNSLNWDQQIPNIGLDTSVTRRAAAIDFMRRLPESADERAAKLRFLRIAFEYSPPLTPNSDPLEYNSLPSTLYLSYKAALLTDVQQARMVEILQKEPLNVMDAPISSFPEYVARMTPADRVTYWNDLLAFTTVLPPDAEQQTYLRAWLSYYPKERQKDLIDFLTGAKKEGKNDMSLPADPATRKELLQYLETWGGDPRQAYHLGLPIFSVWLHITSPTVMWLTHFAILAVFVMFTLGWYTRTTSVLAWLGALCYVHRAQVHLFGQDTMQTILLFYLMIGPSGATLSVDAIRARYRAARRNLAGERNAWADAVLQGPQPSWLANFVVRMLQIHFCFIYASSGLSKLKGPSWWEQSAAWATMVNAEFGLIRYRWFEMFIEFCADNRLFAACISTSIVLFTLVVEIGWPFLVWTRLRPVMVMCSITLHAGIAVLMGLTMFSLYMMTLVLCYMPAELIRQRVAWPVGSGRKLTVKYDSRSPIAVKKAALIRSVDVAQQVTFVDQATTSKDIVPTVTLLTPEGQPQTGKDVYDTSFRELVLLKSIWLIGKMPGVWGLVRACTAK